MKTTHKVIALLLGAILPVALAVMALIWTLQQVEREVESRRPVYALIIGANILLGNLRDAESGQRGYALTGDEAFLEQYLAVHDRLDEDLAALRADTTIPAGQQQLDMLAPLVDAKLALFAQNIELRRRGETTALMALAGRGEGRRLMDSIRAGIQGYIRIQESALIRYESALQSSLRRLFAVVIAASLLTLLFSLSLAFFLYRGIQHRFRNSLHQETRGLLDMQEKTNRQLQQTNAILHISEERLAVTLNSIGDAVIATDAQGRVTLLNPLAEKLTGWTQAQAGGRPVNEIFHIISKATRQPATIPVMETLAHGTIQGLANHTILIARNGSECDIADSCAPIRDRDDQVIGAVLVFRDVTGEYAAQQALNDSAALIQTILNTVVDGIITLHAGNGRVETVNPAAERMFGYAGAEIVGQSFSMLIPELDREQHHGRASLEYYGAGDAARAAGLGREVMGRRRDGSMFPMEMAVSEMWLGGERYFTGILRDITVRKQIEAERTRLDQALQEKNVELESARSAAEKANLAKSDFLSSMSHELRTPLSAILGFAQLMESGAPTPTQKRNIEQILKAGWYLLELVNEILDLALIESGKLSLSLEPVSLVDVMHECQAMIEPQAQKRGISVAFPRFDGQYFVKADRIRVKQVLINLLSNAIKYNKASGTVVVSVDAGASGRIRPGCVRIGIEDNGEGLSPEKLAQLFQPFNRLGKETSSEEGTGIGLVMSKRLIELMGGVIGVETRVGQGSVFWFELELTNERKLVHGPAEAAAAAIAGMQVPDNTLFTLLYVEDNPANLLLVEQIIARQPDIRLLSARDGNRGIEMARAIRPDVILMDINLPGISGIQAMEILAADPATMHIPVVALSANAMPRDIARGLAAGFFRYLTKPIKVNEFMDALNAALKFSKIKMANVNKPENV